MATAITRWSPDTCDCTLEYSWDTDSTEDERVHTPHSVIRACEAHTGLTVKAAHAAVLAENQSKNRMHAAVLDKIGRLAHPAPSGDGVVLHPSVALSWAFGPIVGKKGARPLTMTYDGAAFTADELTALHAATTDLAVPITVR